MLETPHTAPGQLDKVQFLALLWTRYMRGDEWVHEGLEVGPPPLRKSIANLPLVVDAFT
jgi:hypothetical protein